MSVGWKNAKLGEVCELIKRGVAPKYIDEGGICVINQKCIRDHSINIELSRRHNIEAKSINPERYIRTGDVLVNSTGVGTLGRVAQVRSEPGETTTVDTHVTIVRPKLDMFYPEFFGYMLIKIEDEIASSGEGASGQTELARTRLENNFNVTYPTSLPEQKRIVAILDEAFTGITQAVANTEKNFTNTYELWMGVLASACSGKLTEDWRVENSNSESAKDMLLRSIARRSKKPQPPIVDTEIIIPDSWVWASPEQLSTNIVDCPHSTPKWADEGLVCIRTTNFRAGYLDLSSVRYVSEATYTERIKRLEPKPGDVLYSREGGILGIACTFSDGLKACLGQRMMLFRLDGKAVYPRYFACILNSPYILAIVKRLTAGAAAPHINIRDIRTFPIPLPPFSEQRQLITILDTAWKLIQHLETIYQNKLTALAELKQSLLQKAFSGELTAEDDKLMEEAAA